MEEFGKNNLLPDNVLRQYVLFTVNSACILVGKGTVKWVIPLWTLTCVAIFTSFIKRHIAQLQYPTAENLLSPNLYRELAISRILLPNVTGRFQNFAVASF